MLPLWSVSATKYVCTAEALAVPLQDMPSLVRGHMRRLAPDASLMQPFSTNAAGVAKIGAGGIKGTNKLSRELAMLLCPAMLALACTVRTWGD